MRFRILIGAHIGDGPAGCRCSSCTDGNPLTRAKNHRYEQRQPSHPANYANDIIVSDVDLAARLNRGSRKFVRLDDEPIREAAATPTTEPTADVSGVPATAPVLQRTQRKG